MGKGISRFLAILMLALTSLPVWASQVTYYHTDALGSVVMESNEAGQVVYQREYRPYGESTLDPPKDGPAYTGHVQDTATGLTYMQQRYYDPVSGRFLSVDPVTADSATGSNFNRYWYGNDNPYKFTDPDGRFGKPEEALVFGIDADTTASTMNTEQRVVSGVLGAIDVARGGVLAVDGAVGITIGLISPADGPVVEGASALVTAGGVMEGIDGIRGVASALDGKERPSVFEQTGEAIGGPVGRDIGTGVGAALTVQGGVKALMKQDGLTDLIDAVRPIIETLVKPTDPAGTTSE
jgi:RHS repeat-associated protein